MSKRIVILGAGESGSGAAILAKEKGFEVFVSDCGTISEPYRALLDQNGVKWEDGINVEWSELLDGLYYYQFEIEDIFGNVKETDFTEMEYKDGEIYLSIDEDE